MKKISLFMAIIMVFGVITPLALTKPTEVEAALRATYWRLEANLDQQLRPIANNDFAPGLSGNVSDGRSLVYFPVVGADTDDKFTMTWYPEDGTMAQFVFTKNRTSNTDYFTVDFNIYKWGENYLRETNYASLPLAIRTALEAAYDGTGTYGQTQYSLKRASYIRINEYPLGEVFYQNRSLSYSLFNRNSSKVGIDSFMRDNRQDNQPAYRVNATLPDGRSERVNVSPYVFPEETMPTTAYGLHDKDYNPFHDTSHPLYFPQNDPASPDYIENPNTTDPNDPNYNPNYIPEMSIGFADWNPNYVFAAFWQYVRYMAGITSNGLNSNVFISSAISNYFKHVSPSFNITMNGGFTFEYDGHEISFLWNERMKYGDLGDTESMLISVDMVAGKIYEFNLEYETKSTGSQIYEPIKHFVFPGLAMGTGDFAAIPFSINDKSAYGKPLTTWNDALERYEPDFRLIERSRGIYEPDLLNNTFDTTILDISPNVPEEEKIAPATDQNGLSIRFNMPESYNHDTRTFETIGTHPYFDDVITVNFNISGPETAQTTIQIRDIAGVLPEGPQGQIVGGSSSFEAWTPSAFVHGRDEKKPAFVPDIKSDWTGNTLSTERLEFGVIGLPAHSFYNSANVTYARGSNSMSFPETRYLYSAANSTYRYRPIYTFMEYQIQMIDGIYQLGVNQLDGAVGNYQLKIIRPADANMNELYGPSYPKQNDFPTFSSMLPSDPTTPVLWFPLPDDTSDSPVGRYYQVYFREGPNREGEFDVFSQIIVFNPPKKEATISTPNNFKIMKGVDSNHMGPNGVDYVDKAVKLYVREDDPLGATGFVEFWTQWDVIEYTALETLMNDAETYGDGIVKITYQLNKVLSPIETGTPEYFTDVLMEIRRREGAIIGQSAFEVRYSILDPKRDYPIIIPAYDTDSDGWTALRSNAARVGNSYIHTYYADIHFKADAARVVYPEPLPPPMFYYPNIYFMNVTPIELEYHKENGLFVEPRREGASKYDSMTLSDITHNMPTTPQNIKAIAMNYRDTQAAPEIPSGIINEGEDRPDVYVSYDVPLQGVKKYLETMFTPEYLDVRVNLYIGTNEAAIKRDFYPKPPDQPNQSETGHPLPNLYDREEILPDKTFDFFDLLNTTGKLPETYYFAGAVLDLTPALEALRHPVPNPNRTPPEYDAQASSVVRISNVPLFDTNGSMLDRIENLARVKALINSGTNLNNNKLMLTNLDNNQKYYIFVDIVVTQYEDEEHTKIVTSGTPPGPVRVLQDPSPVSGLVGVSIAGEVIEPGPSEIDPPAPNVDVKRPVEQTFATIFWNKIKPEAGAENVRMEYEVIRLDGWEMSENEPNDFGSKEVDFEKFFRQLGGENARSKTGWRTNGPDLYVMSGDRMTKVEGQEKYDYYPDYDLGDPITLTDKTLVPNQVYFYYVRTKRYVNIIGDPQLGNYEKALVSSWSRVTVTTTPVRAPFNLKVESGRTDYNKMNEVIVSWDAEPFNFNDLYGTDLIFQYQLKENDKDWTALINIPAANLMVQDGNRYSLNGDGTMHFLLKLTGLNENSSYQMRVCMYDIRMDDHSLYSNTVTFLTGFNSEEYEKDKETDDWLDYIRKLLDELLGQPYWITFESDDTLSVVLRPGNMFNTFLLGTTDSMMKLYNNDADNVTYYIPASVLRRANAAEKGFKLPYEDLDILTAPNMLNEAINDTFMRMNKAIKDKETSDFFVRLTVRRTQEVEIIEMHPPLTKETGVRVDGIGTVPEITDISAWDTKMYNEAVKLIDNKLKDPALRQTIRKQVEAKVNDESMMFYLESLALGVRNELMRDIHSQLRPGNGKNGIFSGRHFAEFEQFDASMFLVAKGLPEYTTVNGFKAIEDDWVTQFVSDHYNGKAISTRVPGVFVFTGRTVDIPGIENVPKGGNISAFTAKYGLEDFLGYDGVDLNQTATRYMVAGCVARMAGAPKDADPINWVNANLNVTLSSRNTNGQVQTQEAAAMVMALYEKKTKTDIKKMTIRNYQATARMTGLDDRYTQAVRAGFETGVLTDTDMRPADNITIRKLLDMLAALDGKVKL